MIPSILVLLRRTAVELLLVTYASATAAVLFVHREEFDAALGLTLAFTVAARALLAKSRAGTLRLAWSCPHVDALGLRLPLDPLAWRAAEAGEAVLSALDGHARSYREFFPTARRDVRLALMRALDPHAPVDEVDAVAVRLREIEKRLYAVRSVRVGPDPLQALESLSTQSSALADAVSELAPRANVIQLRSGGRS